ncbi:methyl-accepting chemotaxis protein [Aestuariispira insulae]|uniref:Methyl-accepting chemotaxis protein n=1 Tax=Aestuariispira insulae TaxID=1461337 RepID=A0A3D9HJF9_9PROT|nr:methyl-accepting chemotaxis protein [Aestuariispira insulae]RED49649.1 methyl-accepting chemotaxis protein [Aestuariispira insulae]
MKRSLSVIVFLSLIGLVAFTAVVAACLVERPMLALIVGAVGGVASLASVGLLLVKVLPKQRLVLEKVREVAYSGGAESALDGSRLQHDDREIFEYLEIIRASRMAVDQFLANEVKSNKLQSDTVSSELIEIAGDLDKQVKETGVNVAQNVSLLSFVSEQMSQKANTASGRMEELSRESENVGNGVSEAARETERVRTEMQHVGEQMDEASSVAKSAVEQADGTRRTIQGLSEAVVQIGNVVTLINEIAEQTNLLALNATIEAARAGEAGKGFAVVANEVKSLASQTSKATDEIQSQITNIRAATDESVNAIEEIAKVVGRIDEVSTEINKSVGEQVEATRHISQKISDAANGAKEVSQSTSEILEAVSSTRDMSMEVQKNAVQSKADVDSMTERLTALMADLRRSAAGNRRAHTRHSLNLDAELRGSNETFPVKVVDLSLGGGLLKDTLSLPIGEPVFLTLPGLDKAIRGIVYQYSQKGTHLQLTADDAKHRKSILAYLSTYAPDEEFGAPAEADEDAKQEPESDAAEEDDIDLF